MTPRVQQTVSLEKPQHRRVQSTHRNHWTVSVRPNKLTGESFNRTAIRHDYGQLLGGQVWMTFCTFTVQIDFFFFGVCAWVFSLKWELYSWTKGWLGVSFDTLSQSACQIMIVDKNTDYFAGMLQATIYRKIFLMWKLNGTIHVL